MGAKKYTWYSMAHVVASKIRASRVGQCRKFVRTLAIVSLCTQTSSSIKKQQHTSRRARSQVSRVGRSAAAARRQDFRAKASRHFHRVVG